MLNQFLNNPLTGLITLLALVVAITIHEYAHAWVANLRGDPTAKAMGRLTLNPLAHLDPLGTLLLLIVGFGWGKPVPVDEFNLPQPRQDMALISLAGPGSNILGAIISGILLHIPLLANQPLIFSFLYVFILLNLILAFFNLIPLYPLDGSKILLAVLPADQVDDIDQILKEYSLIFLILLLIPIIRGQSLISLILDPLIRLSLNLLLI